MQLDLGFERVVRLYALDVCRGSRERTECRAVIKSWSRREFGK